MTIGNQLSFLAPQTNTPYQHEGLTLFFDGAARNNPGPAGVGIVIKRGVTLVASYGFFIGNKTNNQAEYLALMIGLIAVKEQVKTSEKVTVYSDSELLIQQMSGNYRVKNPILQQLFNAIRVLSKDMTLTFKHIRRTQNTLADQLANQGIDAHQEVPEKFKRVLHEYHITL